MTADRDTLETLLHEVHAELAGDARGAVATFIPELARVDPHRFGLAACTPDGEVVAVGDADVPFTLQSVSKAFVYGLALARFGAATVHERVGVEPTGDPFDAIVRVERMRHRPHNPMVNAGAVAIAGLFARAGLAGERGRDELFERLGAFAGRGPLALDEAVWRSERATAHRNRAIAHLLRYFRVLEAPVEETLDLYFRQCAATVTARELAVMAATLACGGRNPVTGDEVLSPEVTGTVLAVMSTCGLYDASGRFLFDVGLPGKSGVSGALLAVAPGRLGLAAWSPPLDAEGNSVRGVEAVRRVSERLRLHAFEPRARTSASTGAADGRAALERAVARAHERARFATGGAVADYAPLLATADPELLGLAACTVDGVEVAAGDVARPFTLQAAANPLGYAYAVREVGAEAVLQRAGVEPSGNPFHEILLDPRSNRPYNPLGNAGAIVVAGLAPGADAASRLAGLLAFVAELAGERAVAIDAAMLDAERAAGERNRAIASLLAGAGLVQDRDAALELYLAQCCIELDCVRLARIAATLANGGTCPRTGRTVLPPDVVRRTLSVMATCGHHDESGRVAVELGLPAKSGISGAVLAVAPGRTGIAAWSPAVNDHGTSVRGLAAATELSRALGLATFAPHPR